jgi:hypothetical protein
LGGADNHGGRPIPGYSFTYDGHKIPDEEIKELISELICSDGYPVRLPQAYNVVKRRLWHNDKSQEGV